MNQEKDGGSSLPDEYYVKAAEDNNRRNREAFAGTAFPDRIILVPQCMRQSGKCVAKDAGSRYECARCGSCKVNDIIREAEILGYKSVLLLKGGRAVVKIIEELKPKAILGVACFFEGSIGINQCAKRGITVMFYPLSRDGCADTDLDTDKLFELMRIKA